MRGIEFLPEYLRRRGYVTARVGKVFHIGRDVPECWDVSEEGTPDNGIQSQPQEPGRLGLTNEVVAEGRLNGDGPENGRWLRYRGEEERLVDVRAARRGVELLEQGAAGGRPFFVAVGLRRPHLLWLAPEDCFDRYPLEALPVPDPDP